MEVLNLTGKSDSSNSHWKLTSPHVRKLLRLVCLYKLHNRQQHEAQAGKPRS